jgi:isoleucyl-tRNA synthetase
VAATSGVSEDGKEFAEVVRLVLNPIWNTFSFLTTYANIDGHRARFRCDAEGALDRYLLAKTAQLRASMTAAMDAYDIPGACNQVASYLDALTNWYVRRSRDRFWAPARRTAGGELSPDKTDAYDTLYTALTTLCRLVAPLLPMVAEEVYTGLTGETSVHLADWPTEDELPADEAPGRRHGPGAGGGVHGAVAAGGAPPAHPAAPRRPGGRRRRCRVASALRRPHHRRTQREGGAPGGGPGCLRHRGTPAQREAAGPPALARTSNR